MIGSIETMKTCKALNAHSNNMYEGTVHGSSHFYLFPIRTQYSVSIMCVKGLLPVFYITFIKHALVKITTLRHVVERIQFN